MAATLLQLAMRRSAHQIRHVSPIRPRHAHSLVAEVYRQVEREFGMLAPPISLHSPAPEALAACWMMLRETLIAPGQVDRATKEAVATSVSLGNTCPYCVEVHGTTLHSLAPTAVDDPVRAAIADWAWASGTRAGASERPAPFPAEQTAELVGVAVTFQYLNRMVNVFLGESPLPPTVPASARDRARRLLGRIMRSAARRSTVAGRSADLLPTAPDTAGEPWAVGNASVATAVAQAGAAFEAAGQRSVPTAVRELVTAHLADWTGEPPGVSRAWITSVAAEVPAAHRAAARLALLTARASYQVDESVIAQFRAECPDDRALVELTSWASWSAARRVGSWMTAGEVPSQSGEDRHAA